MKTKSFMKSFMAQFKNWAKFEKGIFVAFIFSLLLATILPCVLIDNDFSALEIVVITFSFLSALACFMCNMMLSRGNVWNFAWAFLQGVLYLVTCIFWGIWGQVILSLLVWIPVDFIGAYTWLKNSNESGEVEVATFTPKEKLYIWIGFAFVTVGFSLILFFVTNDTVPILDAAVFTSATCALILAILRKPFQWPYWLFMNICQVAMFSILCAQNPGDISQYVPQIVLRAFMIILTLIGWANWSGSTLLHENIYSGNRELSNSSSGTKAVYKKEMKSTKTIVKQSIEVTRNHTKIKPKNTSHKKK